MGVGGDLGLAMPMWQQWASEVGEWFVALIEGRQFRPIEVGPGEGPAWPVIVALLFVVAVLHIRKTRGSNA